jgi:hypothetical protein
VYSKVLFCGGPGIVEGVVILKKREKLRDETFSAGSLSPEEGEFLPRSIRKEYPSPGGRSSLTKSKVKGVDIKRERAYQGSGLACRSSYLVLNVSLLRIVNLEVSLTNCQCIILVILLEELLRVAAQC